jgi:hypothetical protein
VISLTSRPLYPKQNCPGTHFMGSCVGTRVNLEAAMSASVNNRTLTLWLLSLVTILTELSLLHHTEFFPLKPNNNVRNRPEPTERTIVWGTKYKSHIALLFITGHVLIVYYMHKIINSTPTPDTRTHYLITCTNNSHPSSYFCAL